MQSHPFSLEGLKERIEAFAPPEHREARQQLIYRVLEAKGQDASASVLHSIVQAHALFLSEDTDTRRRHRARSEAEYRKRCGNLAKKLEKIKRDPLIKELEWTFYDYGETCPHNRLRRECEQLHDRRLRLQLLVRPPFTRVGRELLKRSVRYQQLVKRRERENADLLRTKPSDFCRPNMLPGAPMNPPRRGPRRKDFETFLIQNIEGQLGWKVGATANLLRDIFRYCYGINIGASAIERHWYRIQAASEAQARE